MTAAFTPSYSLEEIRRTAAANRLLSIELEPTLSCNYHCPYCYAANHEVPDHELSFAELTDVARQARELGAERVILLGGEPLLYPPIFELIDAIGKLGMKTELFSNGALVTPETARRLFAAEVKLVLKLNSFRPEVQAELTGEPDALAKAMAAIDHARAAGYAEDNDLLAVSTVICRANRDELPALWQYLRDRRITPYFEAITPQGRATENHWLQLDPDELRTVFTALSELDRRYGHDWEPRPPLAGDRCLRHQYSCLITSTGNVFPCVGIDIAVGNIRTAPLRDIIADSEVIQDLRHHTRTIKSPCGDCELAEECYGCRGAAYQLTGDWLAADPLCWRRTDAADAIRALPVDAAGLIPHAPPIRLLDTLDRIGEKEFSASLTVAPDNPFLTPDGTVAEAAYIEMIAQAMAAGNSFRENARTDGMLIGVKDFTAHAPCRPGDRLRVDCVKKMMFDNWGVIGGTVSRNDEILAEGELKIWTES